MIFETRGGGELQVNFDVILKWRSFAQHAADATEAGGLVLLRCTKTDAPAEFALDEVTTPLPGDDRSRYGFNRNDPGHQTAVNEAFDRGLYCMGEWHTHAEPDPTPSDLDLQSTRESMVDWKRDDHRHFLFIVGQRSVCLWQGDRRDLTIKFCGYRALL